MSFILIASVVSFFVVVPVNRLMDRFKPEEPLEQRKRDCPECLSKIPVNTRRRAFCTAEVGAAVAVAR